MIVVVYKVQLCPGARNKYLELLEANVPLVRAETGCLFHDPTIEVKSLDSTQTNLGNDAIVIVEKWKDLPCFNCHGKAPHMQVFNAAVKDLVSSCETLVTETLVPLPSRRKPGRPNRSAASSRRNTATESSDPAVLVASTTASGAPLTPLEVLKLYRNGKSNAARPRRGRPRLVQFDPSQPSQTAADSGAQVAAVQSTALSSQQPRFMGSDGMMQSSSGNRARMEAVPTRAGVGVGSMGERSGRAGVGSGSAREMSSTGTVQVMPATVLNSVQGGEHAAAASVQEHDVTTAHHSLGLATAATPKGVPSTSDGAVAALTALGEAAGSATGPTKRKRPVHDGRDASLDQTHTRALEVPASDSVGHDDKVLQVAATVAKRPKPTAHFLPMP